MISFHHQLSLDRRCRRCNTSVSYILFQQCFSTPLGPLSPPDSLWSSVHSLLLSTQHFVYLSLLRPPFTLPCIFLLDRSVDIITLTFAPSPHSHICIMPANGLLAEVTEFLVGDVVCICNRQGLSIAIHFQRLQISF